MADNHIDYWEVAEYGGHFVNQAAELVGASPLVNMEAMRTLVADAVSKVDSALEKGGLKRSGLRSGRGDTSTAATLARNEMRRFFRYLGSLDSTAGVDVEAFFPGHKLGNVARLKPADLKARLDEMVRAFALPGSSALPGHADWQDTITTARDTLDEALGSKHDASRMSRQSAAGLRAARAEFLHVYNGVAKPLTRALLRSLGRDHEFKLFFADLQVSEASRPATPTADSGDDTPPPSTLA